MANLVLPRSKEDVVKLQAQVVNIINETSKKNLFDSTILRLNEMIKKLENSERKFYISMGYYGMQDLSAIQERINKANEDYGFRSMSSGYGNYKNLIHISGNENAIDFSKPVELILTDSEGKQKELGQFLINFIEQDQQFKKGINNAAIEITKNAFVEQLNKYAVEVSTKQISKFRITSERENKPTGSYGILEQLGKIEAKQDKYGQWHFYVQFRKDVNLDSGSLARRLQDQYGVEYYQEKQNNNEGDLRTILKTWLENNIQNKELLYYIKDEIENRGKLYDINSSAASISGFLGEVKANAFFRYITNDKIKTTPGGNARTLGKRQEIPIDMIFKNLGFQIKNYEVSSTGRVSYPDYSMRIGNFISDRVNPQAYLKNLLILFFGSEQYNQEWSKSKDPEYSEIYSNFKTLHEPIEDIFAMHLDNIIEISKEFASDLQIMGLGQEGLHFNTFFIYGRFLIPSSAILKSIVYALQDFQQNVKEKDMNSNEYFKATAKISDPEPKPVWTTGRKAPPSALEAANKISINYSVTFYLNRILNQSQDYFTLNY